MKNALIIISIFLISLFSAYGATERIMSNVRKTNNIIANGRDVINHVSTTNTNVLAAIDDPSENVTFNIDAIFNKGLTIKGGKITADNIIYSVKSGNGIKIEGGQNPIISNTGILSLSAGSGITVDGNKITNSGILSLSSGTGISVDGNKITNTGVTSLTAGTGISISGSTITNALDLADSGWTDNGTSLKLTTITDSVGIGIATPTSTLHVVGSSNLAGSVTLGEDSGDTITINAGILAGSSITPQVDLGADLGSLLNRFNNLYVANINSNSSQSFSGQTTFSYAPTDTTLAQASVIINPTTSVANGQLLYLGIAGYQRVLIDEDGDIILGYSDLTSAPATDYPLNIYGHSGTRVSFTDTSGNGYFAGNVGIGTTGPLAKLHVEGSTYVNGGEMGFGLGDRQIYWGSPSTTYIKGNYQGNLSAYANSNLGWYINSSGNVGIGTTAPATQLHITGELRAPKVNKVVVVDGTTYAQTCAGINAALTALGSGGGEVYLPEGDYTCAEQVLIQADYTTIRGSGDKTNIITTGLAANSINLDARDYITLENFRITHTSTGGYYEIVGRGSVSRSDYTGSSYSRISNLTINSTNDYCMNFRYAWTGTIIENNNLRTCVVAITTTSDGGSTYNVFRNNYMEGNDGTQNTAVFADNYWTITGNQIKKSSGNYYGIYNVGSHNTISNNKLVYGGIILATGDNNIVTNNFIESDLLHSIRVISSSDKNIIANNFLKGSATDRLAITIESGDYNSVKGNYITGFTNATGAYGTAITIGAGVTGTDISDNMLYNNRVDISDAGTSTRIQKPTGVNLALGALDNSPDGSLEIIKQSTNPLLMLSSTADADGDYLYVKNSNGYVGIGTTSPFSKLSVGEGSINVNSGYSLNWGTTNEVLMYGNEGTGTDYIRFRTAGNDVLSLTDAGLVGIGTTTPNTALEIGGSGKLRLPSLDSASAPTLQFGDGDSGIYQRTNDELTMALGGAVKVYFQTTKIALSGKASMINETASITNPVFVADYDDDDTGLGSAGLNISSLIAGGTNILNVTTTGVGIGTTAPAYALDVKAAGTGVIARFASDNSTLCVLAADGTLSCTSDKTLKKNIDTISYGLSDVMKLNPVAFNWNFSGDGETKSLGFIAQDVETVIPGLVTVDGNGLRSLNTIGLVPVLARAIQEQQLQILDLSNKTNGSNLTNSTSLTNLSLQTLEAQGAVTFKSTVEFQGPAVFRALAEYFDRVIFHNRVTFEDKDMAGSAIISTYSNKVDVKFSTPFSKPPIITYNLVTQSETDSTFLTEGRQTTLTNVTTDGFTIILDGAALRDYSYNWIAIAAPNAVSTKSESPIQQIINQVAGVSTDSANLSPTPTPTIEITPIATETPVLTITGTP